MNVYYYLKNTIILTNICYLDAIFVAVNLKGHFAMLRKVDLDVNLAVKKPEPKKINIRQ